MSSSENRDRMESDKMKAVAPKKNKAIWPVRNKAVVPAQQKTPSIVAKES